MRRSERGVNRLAFLQPAGNRERSDEQEAKLARTVGGRKQKGSGCVTGHKGDVDAPGVSASVVGGLKLEAKTTKHDSFSVKLPTMRKIEEEAALNGKIGGMVVRLEDSTEYLIIRRDYVQFKRR